MTGSGPAHAILLSAAWQTLRARFAANAGLDDEGNWLSGEQQGSGVNAKADDTARLKLFAQTQDSAHLELEAQIAVSRLRVWQAEGKDWLPLPPEWALRQFMTRREESAGFYVDRDEFESTALARHSPTASNLCEATAAPTVTSTEGTKPRRGRPPGKKFWQHDAELVAQMRVLIQTGVALSPNEAANLLAPKAKGDATELSKARRLRDAYFEAERKGV